DDEILYGLMLINDEIGNYKSAQEYSKKLWKLKHTENHCNKYKRLSCKLKDVDKLIERLTKEITSIETGDDLTNTSVKRLIVLYEERAVYEYVSEDYEKSLSDYKKVADYYQSITDCLGYHEDEINKWYELLIDTINNNGDSKETLDMLFNLEDTIDIWTAKLETMNAFSQFSNPLAYTYILLDKYPDNLELLELTAKISRYDDTDYSRECYKRIIELDDQNEDAILTLLDINKSYYLKDESLALINSKLYIDDIKENLLIRKIELLESMTLYPEALETYDEYLSIEKPDGLIHHKKTVFDKIRCMEQQAMDYYTEGNLDEAYNTFKKVNETFNNITPDSSRISTDEWIIEEWYVKVLDKAVNSQYDNSREFFNEFYTLKRDTISLWIAKINSLLSWKHFGNPIRLCDILLSYNPDNLQIRLAKADIFYRTKRIGTAIDNYEDILRQNPDNMEALNRKFNLLVRFHKYRQAYVLLNSMEIIYDEIRSDLEDLADALFNSRKYKQALYCYNILMDNGRYMPVFKNLKIIWDKIGDSESQNASKFYLDWIDAIQDRHKENKCPTCGGKLIPITYGYVVINPDEEEDVYLGGCCVNDDSPTDYCKKCKKELNMGVYGIIISEEDYGMYSYARDNIIWLTKYVERYPKKTIKQLQNEAYKIFGLDNTEFTAFIEKLEEIGYISMDKNHLKLAEGYDKFHTLFV
ncbi:MAG: hypothetical protein J6S29_01995, partial [Methanosphaera sp.]|nr:hypothetical protein [Methanosphaera sp.]